MNIEKHLIALLYRYQCVIVPNFGAFLTDIKSSYYNEEEKTFFPPQKLISFNINIKHNDGLLANHIAMQEKISYELAIEEIEMAVSAWNTELNTYAYLQIQGVGHFKLNSEGNLVFTPTTTHNYLASSFGLSNLTATIVSRSTEIESEPTSTPIIQLETPKRTKYNFTKYAAVFTIFIGISSVLVNNAYDAYIDDQTFSVERSVQSKLQNHIQEATFVIEPNLPALSLAIRETKEEEEIKVPYHIVASAFRSSENASKAVDQLKQKGFENASFLGKTRHGMYPVLYGSYQTQEEAQLELKKIHRSVNNDAWILVQ